jgi:rhamnulokinase
VRRHLAVDLGASGGRVALGTVADGKLSFEILHRWSHAGVSVRGRLYWDVLAIWKEMIHGLTLAPKDAMSIGVNTWGVDYGLLDEGGALIEGVHHYRCARNDRPFEEVRSRLGDEFIYGETGIQFMPFNTIFQLVAHRQESPRLFASADRLLMLPDLFHYWLSGVKANERTIASTSQLYDPSTGTWSETLLGALSIPSSLFDTPCEPGTVLGGLEESLADETGLSQAKVVLPASHDTASAVAAVPAIGDDWAYVSSGTWSLVGVETSTPFLTPDARATNLTNEAGIKGTTRLLKNVMGLWILQECRRAWGDVPFDQLYREAEAYETGDFLHMPFAPDALEFLPPGTDMPERVLRALRWSREALRGEIVRAILESLAQKTAEVIDSLERVTGRTIRVVHIVGGGSQIDLLNRLICYHSRRKVVAGPVEATLMGNLLVQAEAMGSIEPGSIRDVVRAGTTLKAYEP